MLSGVDAVNMSVIQKIDLDSFLEQDHPISFGNDQNYEIKYATKLKAIYEETARTEFCSYARGVFVLTTV